MRLLLKMELLTLVLLMSLSLLKIQSRLWHKAWNGSDEFTVEETVNVSGAGIVSIKERIGSH